MCSRLSAILRNHDAEGLYFFADRVGELPDSFDDLWRRASDRYPCAVVRGSSFLEWQFLRQPGKKFDVLGLYEDGRLMGYVVLFFRKPEQRL